MSRCRRRSAPAVLALLLLGIAPAARAAGIVTHGEVAHRAAQWFHCADFPRYDLLATTDPAALEGGAAFPDWGYAFGRGAESEAAHWDPFLLAAASYLRETYPEPSADRDRLAVFLLGVAAHDMADVPFHALGVADGLLEALGDLEFGGDTSAAHDVGDFGGDVVCATEYDLGYRAASWFVPADDMSAVYARLGYDVSAFTITTDMLLLFAGGRIEGEADLLFSSRAAGTPFLVEELQDWFAGGLDDMAWRAAQRWPELIDWLENGPPAGPKRASAAYRPLLDRLAAAAVLSRLVPGVSVTVEGRGLRFRRLPAPPVTGEPKAGDPSGLADRSLTFVGDVPSAYLGTALAAGDFDGDGRDDLAVGAPGLGTPARPLLGTVLVALGRDDVAGHETLAPSDAGLVLLGEGTPDRFGQELAAADFDGDGHDDLVVGSPTAGGPPAGYRGRVDVFRGAAGAGLHATPGATIRGDADRQGLGTSLAVGDVDGDGTPDLLVGTPRAPSGGTMRGELLVFAGGPALDGTLAPFDAALRIAGAVEHGWFGARLAVADAGMHGRLLLVSAPMAEGRSGARAAGRLYAWRLPLAFASPPPAPAFVVRGVQDLGRAAWDFAIGDPRGSGVTVLALAEPTAPGSGTARGGRVSLLPLGGLAGEVDLDAVSPATTFLGDLDDARLGRRLAFADWNGDGIDDLWLAAPHRGTGADRERGAVWWWSGGMDLPAGTVPDPTAADAEWSGTAARAQHGSALVALDFDGDGCDDLAVGAPRESLGARLSGTVTVALSPFCPGGAAADADADPDADAPDEASSDAEAGSDADADADSASDALADGDVVPADADVPVLAGGSGCGCRVHDTPSGGLLALLATLAACLWRRCRPTPIRTRAACGRGCAR